MFNDKGERIYKEMASSDWMIETQEQKRRNCKVCKPGECRCLVMPITLYADGTDLSQKHGAKPLSMTINTFTTPITNKVRTMCLEFIVT